MSEYFGQGIPWVKSGDLPDGPITKTDEQITQLGLDNSAAKQMPPGTICMALCGATIGKLGTMTFVAATNQATANLVPTEHALAERDCRDDEPASVLLERIRIRRRQPARPQPSAIKWPASAGVNPESRPAGGPAWHAQTRLNPSCRDR